MTGHTPGFALDLYPDPWNISPDYLSCLFQGHEKDSAQKSKLITERFYVHSSPLIYWKFQHLNRREKTKSAGILAGWRVIEKRSEFPQNKYTKPRLLSTASQTVSGLAPLPRDQGKRNGRKTEEALSLESHTNSDFKGGPECLPVRGQDPDRPQGLANIPGVGINSGWNQALPTFSTSFSVFLCTITSSGPWDFNLEKSTLQRGSFTSQHEFNPSIFLQIILLHLWFLRWSENSRPVQMGSVLK